jgi:hypothetical protein
MMQCCFSDRGVDPDHCWRVVSGRGMQSTTRLDSSLASLVPRSHSFLLSLMSLSCLPFFWLRLPWVISLYWLSRLPEASPFLGHLRVPATTRLIPFTTPLFLHPTQCFPFFWPYYISLVLEGVLSVCLSGRRDLPAHYPFCAPLRL